MKEVTEGSVDEEGQKEVGMTNNQEFEVQTKVG